MTIVTYVRERQKKVINRCTRNATGIVQTLHHTLRVLKINSPHAAIIEFVGASDLNSVRAVLLSCCSLIRSIDESERCDLRLQITRVIPYLNSDINFLDSKSLIINFLGQDFESYMVQTTVNADCFTELFAI